MTRAARFVALALLGLALCTGADAAAEELAVETTVTMPAPDRAVVVTRVRFEGEAASSGFHSLVQGADDSWQRETVHPRQGANGELIFEREVIADPDGWLRIAVPLPDTAPVGAADISFVAQVTPPSGHRIVDAFPTAASDADDGAIRMALPAPPSLLRFRVIPESASAFGVAHAVDAAVALLLLSLAAFGIVRLLRPAPSTTP